MKKIIAMIIAAVMTLTLTACSRDDNASDTSEQTTAPETSEVTPTAEAEDETLEYRRPISFEEVYSALMAEQPADVEPPVMFLETDTELVYSVYPGLENVDIIEMAYYCPPVMGYPCELLMIECKTQRDADYAYEVMLDRIGAGASDTDYPENAEGWATLAEVHSEGVYVAMVVLPVDCEIPFNIFVLVE